MLKFLSEVKTMDKKLTKKESLWQAIKFVLFSISAGVIQLGLSAIFEIFTNNWWLVYLIPLVASVIWNFTFNRKFTFNSANNIPLAMILVTCYYAVFTPLSGWWGAALTNVGWHNLLVVGFNMIINFITEFLFDKFVVFNDNVMLKIEKAFHIERKDKKVEEHNENQNELEDSVVNNEVKAESDNASVNEEDKNVKQTKTKKTNKNKKVSD